MTAERSRHAAVRPAPPFLAPLFALLLASCASSTDSQLDVAASSLAPGGSPALTAVDDEAGKPTDGAVSASATAGEAGYSDPLQPPASSQPAAKPVARSAAASPEASMPAPTLVSLSSSADDQPAPNLKLPPSGRTPAQIASAMPPDLIDPGKRKFLSSFFGDPKAGPHPLGEAPAVKPLIDKAVIPPVPSKARTLVKLASADASQPATASLSYGDDNALPGVRQTMLFEIRHKNSVDDDSDIDVNEDDGFGPVRTASAAGMARLAPDGLLKQNDTVDTACLKPDLVRVLRSAEQHFGQKAVITSGYRDPERNRRARGATHSLHMACMAADVQIPGVSKWELASYFRAMPGRGGVGTYCHTTSVHVDIGPERDWNWRCDRAG